MRFAIMFGFFLIATWMRDNPVPDWMAGVFIIAAIMDVVDWISGIARWSER